MKIRFLCPRHRQWLEGHPWIAADRSLCGYDTALALMESGDYGDALAHAGCALEAADIVMAGAQPVDAGFIRHYAGAGALLAELLRRMGHGRQVGPVIHGCLARMEGMLQRGADRRSLLDACGLLLRADAPEAGAARTMGAHRSRSGPISHTVH